ncbi:MAG: glycoside hydrolase family 2 protein [Lentimicrobiaceae bacterium]|nr:glycoside hydrolase family 2 protein [Lentimicrobiaceae bacterium]
MYRKLILFFLVLPFFSCQTKKDSLFDLNQNWTFEYENKQYAATVPGCIHTDLMNAGIIPDPFYRCNEDSVQWVADRIWVYRTVFDGKQINKFKHAAIYFSGLDTYAEVYLNGEPLFHTEGSHLCDNMFRPWCFPLPKTLKNKNNELVIKLLPSEKINEEKAKQLPYTLPDDRVFTRKAPYQSGWDWGPKLVTCGVYKPVKIIAWDDYYVEGVELIQRELTDEKGVIEVVVMVVADREMEVEVEVKGRKGEKENGEGILSPSNFEGVPEERGSLYLKPGPNQISQFIEIENPELWWPNGLGEQKMYDFEVTVGATTTHKRWGFRTIELVQEKDEIGESFYFKINNIPVFMKGANWIPAHSFVSEMEGRKGKERYKMLLESCKDANMNMIRVWGGGVYEHDYFYELCDELGLLVWQDFMFACALYPADTAFLKNVKKEAEFQAKRLNQHPSLALWCGNNEVKNGWEDWGWQKQYTSEQRVEIGKNLHTLFNELLPEVVKTNSDRPYHPSSPLWGWGHPECLTEGDSHYWGVWWGEEPFEVWLPKTGRFMSEYGFQSYPQMSTIESFTLPEDRNLASSVMKNHQKHPRGVQIINKAMQQYAHIPDNLEDYVRVSQEIQAYGIGKAIEAHRLKRPHCMGTLYWQLNDCWPVASWSSIDFFGNWKLLHHTVKEKFAPVIIAIEDLDNGAKNIYIVNDLLHDVKGEIMITHKDYITTAIPFHAKENSSSLIVKNYKKEVLKTELVLY